ncbi:MAG: lytic murein transglycosylase B [Xanthomonadales bacterium]|nr:Membrane-bound lytic murein transglycosylase B [Xanthomonadales bacterium]MCC6593206.1 lytic murein transglycosylase B [Xanthomonadales bacterium]MCE7930694.1 lytic murein transglycosylase B [Xanthomonadales bacterium PRO6]
MIAARWTWCLCLLCALAGEAAATAEKHPGMEAVIAELAAGDEAIAAQARALLQGAEYRQAIIDAISRPAEGVKPWYEYRKIFLTEERIAAGAAYLAQHRQTLAAAQDAQGVPAEYVVAIIGVETFYGRITGKWKVIDALVTLGLYYPPRQPFFRGELLRFLGLPRERGIELDLANVQGSYAGAMGLGQFMPTSLAKWAVDADADGRIDLWTTPADIHMSVAHYLREHGWAAGQPVLAEMVPGPGARRLRDTGLDPVFPFSQLVEWGYQPPDGSALPPDTPANLLTLEVAESDYGYWAIFGNFRAITKYNRSPMYALAVHQLAQEIAARAGGE